MRFYEEYKRSDETKLSSFYRVYEPPITSEQHTCVGLGLKLLEQLEQLDIRFPRIKDSLCLVSCEEAIHNIPGYIQSEPSSATCEKEHVLVAMQLRIGGRLGILLLDPGYHVARVITVMKDHSYPHTGWFTQSDESHVRKDYCYTFCDNRDYVQWLDRETRQGVASVSESIIYTARPYLTPVRVTERRNLVYNFRSLLARDTKGHLIGGMYFPVKEIGSYCTVFYQDGEKRTRVRVSLMDATRDTEQNEVIQRTCYQLGLPEGNLDVILARLYDIMADRDFIKELLEINRQINGISKEN